MCSLLVDKPEGKRPLGRLGQRWEDNVTINLKETGWNDVNWIHLAQDTDKWWDFVNMEHGNEPSVSTECEKFLDFPRNYWLLRKDSIPCS
jgi:hypothetical protein